MKKKRSDLDQINQNAAGIDIGSEFHYVAVPEDRDENPIRKFACYTADLKNMAKWLKECNIDTVAMESTGVYWIPVFQVLESSGLKVILVNAHNVKNVPGRKTDVCDSRWLQQLHTFGLLNGSYQPEAEIRKLRTYMRQVDCLTKSKTTHIQRMQKNLIQMNIQLHKVLSDISGETGMKIIRSIISGERNTVVLAKMRNKYVKSSEEKIAKSLEGNYKDEYLFCLKQEVEQFDYICNKIEECEKEINSILKDMNGEDPSNDSGTKKNKKKLEKELLESICNVDLTQITGLDVNSIKTIISEVGLDMSKWPTEKHFGSWLGLCPNNKISGGVILSSKSRKVVNKASTAFRLAAYGASHSNSYIGSFYRRLRLRMGAPKAMTATAYKIAKMFYLCLKFQKNYIDLGKDYYETKYKERMFKNLSKKAENLGYSLMPIPT